MSSLLRAVSSEWLKHRRTLTRRLLVLAPAALVLLYALVGALIGKKGATWPVYLGAVSNWWVVLCVPVGAALLAALATSIEERSGAWRVLRARPASPAMVYLAKLVVLALHALIAALLLAVIATAAGALFIGGDARWAALVSVALLSWLVALPVIAIQLWAAAAGGFVVSVLAGVGGFLAGVLAAESGWWVYVPWAWPVRVSIPLAGVRANGLPLPAGDPLSSPGTVPPVIVVSLAALAVITSAGLVWFSRREVR